MRVTLLGKPLNNENGSQWSLQEYVHVHVYEYVLVHEHVQLYMYMSSIKDGTPNIRVIESNV